MKKILLLDIENLQKTEKDLLKYLAGYQAVYLVYAKSPVSFSLDALVKLSPFISKGKLKVLKMPKVAQDAADFGLAFIVGQLSIQVKKDVAFDIMSNDHAMQYIVDLLKMAKFNAQIIQQKLEPTSQLKRAKVESKKLVLSWHDEQQIQHYCRYLLKIKNNKPSKIRRLRNSIQVALKLEEEHDVDKVLRLLADLNIIQTDHKPLIFAMKHIQHWADKICAETEQRLLPTH